MGQCLPIDGGTITCGDSETGCFTDIPACTDGLPSVCIPQEPTTEICDGIDNDCNGLTDAEDEEGLGSQSPPACEIQEGVCFGCRKNLDLCTEGAWESCAPEIYDGCSIHYEGPEELSCDGKDNDCDGETDEGLVAALDTDPSCGDAITQGPIRGDVAHDVRTLSGIGEARIQLLVSEDDLTSTCQALSVAIHLNPGSGSDYDLVVGCDSCESGSTLESSLVGTEEETLSILWEEGCEDGVATDTDSGRELWIEVVHKTGDGCAPWSLVMEGHTSSGAPVCASK